mmetsp:Transcript_32899/g.83944  ORF Transcript_32899/g.83944 Transcript_32899/m.83944 type:complete len:337 (-) Transcript_32899:209-1219(-)
MAGSDASSGSQYCNLFAVWIAITASLALYRPGTFSWMDQSVAAIFLAMLSFLVGTTTQLSEFQDCMQRPRPIAANLVGTFIIAPMLAVWLSHVVDFDKDMLVGMVLLGSVSGGTASNLCALIAGADVPLSVLMTSSTTLASIVATPALTSIMLGAVVNVDAAGILMSALKVVLAPIILGLLSSRALPRTSRALRPAIPAIGVTIAVLIVGIFLSHSVDAVWTSDPIMHFCVVGLHFSTGFFGYVLTSILGGTEQECRTVALEVGMKNCSLAMVLATKHFESYAVRGPAAASLLWCPILASMQAVAWSWQPTAVPSPKKRDSFSDLERDIGSRAMGA